MLDINLDATDIRILNELQRDARLTNVELAAGSICRPRLPGVRRLETEGLIDRRVTLLNARKLGLKVNVFIQISPSSARPPWTCSSARSRCCRRSWSAT